MRAPQRGRASAETEAQAQHQCGIPSENSAVVRDNTPFSPFVNVERHPRTLRAHCERGRRYIATPFLTVLRTVVALVVLAGAAGAATWLVDIGHSGLALIVMLVAAALIVVLLPLGRRR